jgi:hypothetical protein
LPDNAEIRITPSATVIISAKQEQPVYTEPVTEAVTEAETEPVTEADNAEEETTQAAEE